MRRGSGVGAKSEKLRLEIYIKGGKMNDESAWKGTARELISAFFIKKKRNSVYHITLWWRKHMGFLYFGVHKSIKDLAAG